MSHPIKLVVTDDLHRSRVTVFFRLLLAIPHLVWVTLWGVAALLTTVANWLSALVTGTAWGAGHAFVARWLRYATHVGGYVYLLGNPYPGFLGTGPYPVDLEVAPPARQNRWKTLFRIPLALPAGVLAALFTSGYSSWSYDAGSSSAGWTGSGGLVVTIAFLGWFASLALARMPRGMRDAGAWGLSYSLQHTAYLFVLTDRYPNSDPLAALDDLPADDHPVRIVVEDDLTRSRATVFFRLLLVIPHILWLFLWGIAAFFAMIANWFATLFTGRSPDGLHGFLGDYLRYATHVYAYVYLAANPYPGFDGDRAYDVDLIVDDSVRQDRATVLFRIVLAIPALAIYSALSSLALAVALFGWFASLALGRMPLGLRNTQVVFLHYYQQLTAYFFILTDRYPYSGPTRPATRAEPEPERFLPPDAYASIGLP